ncbi:MAG: Ig-like domain-containing protein [Rubrivivax sp.]
MMKTFRAITALLSTAGLMIGCGGGGDGAGNAFVDMASPTISYVTPLGNQGAVAINAKVTATFSEAMNADSVASALTLIDTTSGLPVALQSVEYDPLNKIATLTPQSNLAANRLFRAAISTAARDLKGNALAEQYAWTFETSAAADTTSPTITSVSPADGSTGVSISSAVSLAFSEPMDAQTLRSAFSLSAGATPVAGLVSYIGQAAAFTPNAALSPNTTYTATLSTAAKDLANNALSASLVWQFTTGATADTAVPTVTGVTPAPSANNVLQSTSISVSFDRAIYPFLFGKIDGQVVPVLIDYATNTVTMTPTVPLTDHTTYSSSVLVKSLAGTSMVSPYEWSFTTGP